MPTATDVWPSPLDLAFVALWLTCHLSLQAMQPGDACCSKLQECIKLQPAKGCPFGRALNLKEAPGTGHRDIQAGVAAGILSVVKI